MQGAWMAYFVYSNSCGHVAELVYAYVSEAYGAILGSSSLPMPTNRVWSQVEFARQQIHSRPGSHWWSGVQKLPSQLLPHDPASRPCQCTATLRLAHIRKNGTQVPFLRMCAR